MTETAAAQSSDAFSERRLYWLSAFGDPAKPRSADTQAAAFIGREDMIRRPGGCSERPGDPIEEIVERARSTNIVIISEAHDHPRDRYFIGEVLSALKSEGYSTYAAEAFPNIDAANIGPSDGHYVQEPMFGRTLKRATELGYKLVAYEIRGDQRPSGRTPSVPIREQAQTDNLMSAIFRERPDEKVVIHVGYWHAMERSEKVKGADTQWMAERLAKATGRNPLTINQSDCSSPSSSTSIFQGPNEGYDLFIGHPAPALTDGRPDWRRAIGDIATPIPGELVPANSAVIIEARGENETMKDVPTDRILLRPGERFPLLLPAGRYRLDGFTAQGPLNAAPIPVDVR